MTRFDVKGKYAQVELNNVAFRRDGRIEAQCKLGNGFDENIPAENGMILVVDKTTNTVNLPSGADDILPYALHYSSEHMYDERANSLGDFALFPNTFLPRMGYLAVGDLFTTNCVCTQDANLGKSADEPRWAKVEEAFKNGTPIFGIPSETGAIELTTAAITDLKDAALILKVVKAYTMPNGGPGLKFQVIKA